MCHKLEAVRVNETPLLRWVSSRMVCGRIFGAFGTRKLCARGLVQYRTKRPLEIYRKLGCPRALCNSTLATGQHAHRIPNRSAACSSYQAQVPPSLLIYGTCTGKINPPHPTRYGEVDTLSKILRSSLIQRTRLA